MKLSRIIIALILGIMATSAHAQELLGQFDMNNYSGWSYTRTSTALNTLNISQGKIYIYGDYMLLSPTINFSGVKYAQVNVTTVNNYYSASSYSYEKASPTLELVDLNGNIKAQVQYNFTEAKVNQVYTVYLPVPSDATSLKVRISAPNGDANSNDAVKEVKIYTSNSDPSKVKKGDVNGDGIVDVSDATALINIILGSGVVTDAADVNGDGIRDVSDVTALMSIILG